MPEQETPPSGTPVVEPDTHSNSDPIAERPELFVAGAFVGGFALAQLLKRIGR
ncbi:MAG TPA: hypothetical protein VGF21_14330 [Thermoleophilaceae bacterium]|jgi:hypothetical protein